MAEKPKSGVIMSKAAQAHIKAAAVKKSPEELDIAVMEAAFNKMQKVMNIEGKYSKKLSHIFVEVCVGPLIEFREDELHRVMKDVLGALAATNKILKTNIPKMTASIKD